MERSLSPEEKIRRAEEIYYRRRLQDKTRSSARVNVSENKKDLGLLKKMILQIIICILIYTIFYMIQNTNYIFSEDVIKKANEILSYDINIPNLYKQGMEYLNSLSGNIGAKDSTPPQDDNMIETNTISSNIINQIKNNSLIAIESVNKIKEKNIGGESVATEEVQEVPLTQMQQDAKDIKESVSLIIPLKGTITSRFGLRDPETPTVPKNHTGIDIAVNEGTVFISAMSGVVEKVSSEGDLGNHLKITDGNVSTVYAHCKTIYVKEGQKINQGEQIGEVGSTGNSTGPHLHFEIKKEGRYVDPDLILKFE
ncbi:MAG: M23 family metallopeptidase [Clostridia bacterium]|nr:M23 family metallopeptidase [Clostridia bacterium]